MDTMPQRILKGPGPLLNADGSLADVGRAGTAVGLQFGVGRFLSFAVSLQRFRVKRWRHHGITTPTTSSRLRWPTSAIWEPCSATSWTCKQAIATRNRAHPALGFGVVDPPPQQHRGRELFCRQAGDDAIFDPARTSPARDGRVARVRGKGLSANLSFAPMPEHESMVIVIPIRGKRFYYNRKVNCMPACGTIEYGQHKIDVQPNTCLGNWYRAAAFGSTIHFGCGTAPW